MSLFVRQTLSHLDNSTHPGPGRPGSGGGDAGYGAVTAPSRPALMTGPRLCTQNCKHFRNEMVEKPKRKSTNL